MLSSGKFARFALAIACLLSALLVFVVLGAGAWAHSQLVSDLLQTAIAAWAAVSAFLATGRSSGYLRRLWRLFTVSLILVVCAQVIESYYENLAHTPFAKPWLSDIVFLLWVIPALIMLLPRPVEELGGIAWETILDFAQLGIVALTAYLYFFYLTSRWGAQGPQMVLKEIWLQMYRMPAAPLLPCEENLTVCVPLKLDREVIGVIVILGLLPPKKWLGMGGL